jgi:uncharacterized membrane protein
VLSHSNPSSFVFQSSIFSFVQRNASDGYSLRGGMGMRNINKEYTEQATLGERLADRLAEVMGSWNFLMAFGVVIVVYIILNCALWSIPVFDRYPFVFLNLLMALMAAIQAPIILMSQNRQARRDKIRNDIDFEITVRSEQEIQDIQRHLHRMEEELKAIRELLD